MEITLPKADRDRYFRASARVGNEEVRLWRDNQVGMPLGDPRIFATAFRNAGTGVGPALNLPIENQDADAPSIAPRSGVLPAAGPPKSLWAAGRSPSLEELEEVDDTSDDTLEVGGGCFPLGSWRCGGRGGTACTSN